MKTINELHLSELEKEIHQYVCEHVDEVQLMSIRKLAQCTYSNTTSIVRYAKKMGYTGFEEFKVKIKNDLHDQMPADFIISNKESSIEVINKMRSLNNQIIDRTVHHMSLEQLNRICKKIEEADCIDFIAYDANAAIADYAAHYFFQVGKICNVYWSIDKQIIFSLCAKPEEHVIFVITRSGKTERIVKVLKELHKRGFYVVLITNENVNISDQYCSELLKTSFVDSFKEMGDCIFFTSAKFLLDTIINLYYSKHFETVLENDVEYTKIYDS